MRRYLGQGLSQGDPSPIRVVSGGQRCGALGSKSLELICGGSVYKERKTGDLWRPLLVTWSLRSSFLSPGSPSAMLAEAARPKVKGILRKKVT